MSLRRILPAALLVLSTSLAVAQAPGGGQRGPGAEEGIEHNVATVGEIDQRSLQHCSRFFGPMIHTAFLASDPGEASG